MEAAEKFLKIIYYLLHENIKKQKQIFNLEIQRSQYIKPKVTVHKGAETIQGRKLYEEIRHYTYHICCPNTE